jgi:hypothetical protein
MTDQVLTILKFVLLGLLYLFFARVLWAVWSEVRTSGRRQAAGQPNPGRTAPVAPAASAGRPPAPVAAVPQGRKDKGRRSKAAKGQRKKATKLLILEPKLHQGKSFPLIGDVTLGRDPDCTISIDDDSFVSHRHLRVFDYEGQPMIEDLGSTNGTYHNGNKLIGSRLLHPGDRVQVGTIVIEAR